MRTNKTAFISLIALLVVTAPALFATITLTNDSASTFTYTIQPYEPAYVCVKAPCNAPKECRGVGIRSTINAHTSETISNEASQLKDEQRFCITLQGEGKTIHFENLSNKPHCQIPITTEPLAVKNTQHHGCTSMGYRLGNPNIPPQW